MGKRDRPRMKQGMFAGLVIMVFASSCSSAPPASSLDPALKATLARYDQFDTFTGSCIWHGGEMALVRNIAGQLLLPDEHSPARFVPRDGLSLPSAARFGGAVAFRRDNPSLRDKALALDGDVLLSGTVVTGDLQCYGNSAYNPGADHLMSAGFLVDTVKPSTQR